MFRCKILAQYLGFLRTYSSFSHFTVKETLSKKPLDSKILVQGWVQAVRKYKDLYFVDLVDGTCLDRLQIVIQSALEKCPAYGSSIKVEGILIKSNHKGQDVELIAENWMTHGSCPTDYPFENRVKYSSEYIRQFPHLRPRTRKISSILRIRNNSSIAVHQFFQNEGFYFVHTPILTQNDCEGAGEVFSVQLKQKLTCAHEINDETDSDEESDIQLLKEQQNLNNSNIDPEEFFGAPSYLTVSGQLHLEAMACALSRVYNFGPVFRAESSRSRQHASEFQMVEAEIAFFDSVENLTDMVERCVKHIAKSIMDNCNPEVNFLSESTCKLEDYLKKIINKTFIIMSYNEAIKILEQEKNKLKVPVQFGEDLSSEHKLFLVKYCNNIPVFVTMFPSSIKPFYMKKDQNNKVAYCFDLFALYGGEICGGSLRENDEEILKRHPVMQNPSLSWYLDLRKYGGVPHGGFGIGFDRLLQSLLGISNIRDIVPFPRRKYDCKC